MKSVTGSAGLPGPPRTPLPSFSSLTRQSSIYTLTLEELQNAVNEPGKNFGSMNMEEFIKNIWTVEESQAMAAAMSGIAEGNGSSSTGSAPLPTSGLQRGLSVPRNLSGKTVDEVWKEIHRSNERGITNDFEQRQLTMAQTTLEDFLAKAGVMREEIDVEPSANRSNSVMTVNAMPMSNTQADVMPASQAVSEQLEWLNFQLKGTMPNQELLQHQHQQLLKGTMPNQELLQHQHQQLLQEHQQQQQQQAEAAAAAYAGRLAAAPAAVILPPVTAANVLGASFDMSTSLTPGGVPLPSALVLSDRKRPQEAIEDKSIEQRQKRMIKNRESAARSRARKQAYNVELESEVEQLKEENARLLQEQAERMKQRRKQLMETLVPITSQPPVLRRRLQRTKTTWW